MRVTLDTNICSYILRRHPENMIERFASLRRENVWLSSIVAAELRFGACKLGNVRFSGAVETWLAGFDVLPWSIEATHFYAQMRTSLEKIGKPIGAMDMLIAAHALAEDSAIITNNAREFHRISGLAVQEWAI